MRSTTHHKKYLELVREICDTEPLAFRWFEQVLETALLWDHIVDRDPIDAAAANFSLLSLTTEWIHNDWYHKNRYALTPCLVSCLSAWRDCAGLECQDVKSFDLYTELPCVLALLLKGQAGVDEYMPSIRALIERERWEDARRDHPPFFIVGLPRSRTAWLAAFLTSGPVHCYHELHRFCDRPGQYIEKLLAAVQPIVGDASPLLPQFGFPAIAEQLEGFKLVFVDRDHAAAEAAHAAALKSAGLEKYQAGWPEVVSAYESLKGEYPGALRFNYDDLDDHLVVGELAEYCTGRRFDRDRWSLFDEMKITALPEKVIKNQRLIK